MVFSLSACRNDGGAESTDDLLRLGRTYANAGDSRNAILALTKQVNPQDVTVRLWD